MRYLALVVLLAGCSTLNDHGIGGEPLLMCKSRDLSAYLDDRLMGSGDMHASMVRRFTDGDRLCGAPLAASAPK